MPHIYIGRGGQLMAIVNVLVVESTGLKAGYRYDDNLMEVRGIGAQNTSGRYWRVQILADNGNVKRAKVIAPDETIYRNIADLALPVTIVDSLPEVPFTFVCSTSLDGAVE